MIEEFQQFLNDEDAPVMYITGVAGTGKTTSLAKLVEYCSENRIHITVSAYTHKAVGVLRSKLPKANNLRTYCTLHKFLKKVPTVNDQAEKLAHVDGNAQLDAPEHTRVLFVDEFSMIGEKDMADINDIIYDEDGEIVTKIVYIGDENQLPPVKDMPGVVPKGKYWVKLTKIYRQAGDNKLLDTLLEINEFIKGKPAEPLTPHETFVRGADIVQKFMNCNEEKILLAYTNKRVQDLNAEIEGKDKPEVGSLMFCPTLRKLYTYADSIDNPFAIVTIRDGIIERNNKFNTLETLMEIKGVEFVHVTNEDDVESPRAMVFGHQHYLDLKKELANQAVKVNQQIRNLFNEDPKEWANKNYRHELAVNRREAWKRFLSFNECVVCMDFNHAMTVHKSQGSTYENVFIDWDDIAKCANSDYQLYLKLLYVAISRASKIVYTN